MLTLFTLKEGEKQVRVVKQQQKHINISEYKTQPQNVRKEKEKHGKSPRKNGHNCLN